MNKELNRITKTFSGNVLGIGIDNKIMDLINKNDSVLNFDILSNDIKGKGGKRKIFNSKRIDINKIRKKFKKKKIDYIICNYESISPYINKFVKNSVYINKNKLYFYGDVDINFIKTRYSRYNTKIDIKEYKNKFIVEIDNTESKNNRLKELFYSIKDTISSAIELIGDVLMG